MGRTELVHRISALVFQSVGWGVYDLTSLLGGFTGKLVVIIVKLSVSSISTCSVCLSNVAHTLILSGQMEKLSLRPAKTI